jgi:RNA polymerase sigma-54 factor
MRIAKKLEIWYNSDDPSNADGSICKNATHTEAWPVVLDISEQQKLMLTKRMQQSLRVLQMNNFDLIAYLQEEALANPLLEVEAPIDEEPDKAAGQINTLEWLEKMDESNAFRYSAYASDNRGEQPLFEKATMDSLEETLLQQLPDFHLSPADERTVRFLIGNLDDNGYLALNREQLAADLGICGGRLESALTVLQRMEPAGVGAADLRECLLIQARRESEPSFLLIALIERHLDELAKNRLDKLAGALGVGVEDVKEARNRLLALNPKPGNGYSAYKAIPYIRPDIFVVRFENAFEVIYNDYEQPKVEISDYYRTVCEQEDSEASAYIRERLLQAEQLVQNIAQRKKTVMACAKAILRRQMRFFELGPGHLSPMTLADLASDLDINPSTVSRAVTGKYLQCQWGVHGLSHFFSRSVSRVSENASQDMAITQLRRIIDGENPASPFSDLELAVRLERVGISISRRTVAKYRKIAGLAAAGGRRRF